MKTEKVKKPSSITLCMIVKNETHIIKECLASMLPYIDRYDITDTGSTDGTPELIKEFFDEHGVEGEVYLSDWKGFGDHSGKMGSRSESLRNCDGKADFAWVIDADDFITGDFKFPEKMEADSYSLRIGREEFTWWRNQIFRTGIEWCYTGILHEYAECKGKPTEQVITDRIFGEYHVSARTEGARNVGITTVEKYTRDAEMLLKALEDEPENVRYQFYLAQSYFDSQQYEKSLEAYIKRAEMGGWEEEVYYSIYRTGIIKALLNYSWPEIQQAFLDCYNYRPIRAEPLYQIARLYRQVHDKPRLGYVFARMAMEIPYPQNDILFISEDCYKYQILDEIGATAYYAGKPHVGLEACKRLIDENLIPESHRERAEANLEQYQKLTSQMHEEVKQAEIQRRADEYAKKKQEKEERKYREKKGTKVNQEKTRYKKRKTAKR